MCLFNKILIGLIVIAIGACFYFSAITLKTHKFWGEKYNNSKVELEQLEKDIVVINYGEGIPDTKDYKKSLEELQKYSNVLSELQGKFFRDCSVDSNFTSNGTFSILIPNLTTEKGLEYWLPVNTPLYAFTQSSTDVNKMEYLGRFRVRKYQAEEGSSEFQVIVEPTRAVYENNKRMQEVLSKARGVWTIFLKMPIDTAKSGSENEDYIPFETRINYYIEQESILQKLIDKQEKHIKAAEALIGNKHSEKDESVFHILAVNLRNELELNLKDNGSPAEENIAFLYKKFEDENKAMKDANAALASEVQRLESTKKGYERSIEQRMKPISIKQ